MQNKDFFSGVFNERRVVAGDECAKHDSIEDMLRFRAHALNRGKYFIVKKRSVSLVHHFGD